MNQSDITNYSTILSNTKINYSDKLWLGITNNVVVNNNTINISEKLEQELNERKYNTNTFNKQ